MNTEHLLEQASRLVSGDGDPCDFGCSESDAPRLRVSQSKLPSWSNLATSVYVPRGTRFFLVGKGTRRVMTPACIFWPNQITTLLYVEVP